MKIGIITLHRTCNYGGVLQPFALQRAFEEHGAQVEIIDFYDYDNTILGQLKLLKGKSEKLKNPILHLGALGAFSISYIKKKIVFDKFIKNRLHLSEYTYCCEADFYKHMPEADVYCSGGDQVWHSVVLPRFFPFIKDKPLVAYSASFGKDSVDTECYETIRNNLSRFKLLSSRENTGVEILNSMGFEDAIQVIDATLLFTAEEWACFSSNKFRGKKYILTYNLNHDKTLDNYSNYLSKKYNLPIYNINMHWFEIIRPGKNLWCPSVEKYLGLFQNAEYVIGDSFHGMVFSVLFHRPFTAVVPKFAGTRLESFASLLGLTNHIVKSGSTPDADFSINLDIDWNYVDDILSREREKANQYIDQFFKL